MGVHLPLTPAHTKALMDKSAEMATITFTKSSEKTIKKIRGCYSGTFGMDFQQAHTVQYGCDGV